MCLSDRTNCSHFANISGRLLSFCLHVSSCLQMCIISPTYGYDLEGLSRDKTDFDLLWLTTQGDLVGMREFSGQDWYWLTAQDDCRFEVVPKVSAKGQPASCCVYKHLVFLCSCGDVEPAIMEFTMTARSRGAPALIFNGFKYKSKPNKC